MLSYAFTGLNFTEYNRLKTEEFDNIYDLFSEILIIGLNKQIKQGLHRDYVETSEDTTSPRGKINITQSMNLLGKLNCSYDEFSVNSYLNKIIKTTLGILLKAGIDDLRRRKLKNILLYFRDVDTLDVKDINWKVRYDRNNKSYRMIIAICRLIIDGLIYSDEKGNVKLLEFLDDSLMSRLYEKFILEYYKREHSYLKAYSPQIKWQLDDDEDYLLPRMQTDVTLEYEGKVLIIDAKFYSKIISGRWSETVSSANLYQIFTYVKNYDGDASGMLLYAGTEEKIQPDVVYSMSGNRIAVKTLDLYCEFVEIKKQLDEIVSEYFS